MPWDIILLPLLGGFWFITLYYRTRFKAMQALRHILFFYAASLGIILAIIARALTLTIAIFWPNLTDTVKLAFFPWPFSGTAAAAFILGPVLAWTLNIRADKNKASDTAIRKMGDELEKMLLLIQEEDDLVVITLKSGKVYIGLVQQLPANLEGPSKWMVIIPYFSGHRDPITKTMVIDTEYLDIIIDFKENERLSEEMFKRVIRVDDIETCGRFDVDVWNTFHNDGAEPADDVEPKSDR